MNFPAPKTVAQIHALLGEQVKEGNGDQPCMLDRRGLGFLDLARQPSIAIYPPLPGESPEDGRFYLRAVF